MSGLRLMRFPTCRQSLVLATVLVALGSAAGASATASAHRPTPATHATAKSPASSPIAGHWEADMQGDGRMFTWLFDFTVKGDSLGGVLGIAGRDDEIRVAGTIKGSTFHFEQFGLWDGTVQGATLKISRGLDGGKVQHMVAHRAPRK